MASIGKGRTHFQQVAWPCAALAGCLLMLGCAWRSNAPPPTVDELFQEAMRQSARQPDGSYAESFERPVTGDGELTQAFVEEIPLPEEETPQFKAPFPDALDDPSGGSQIDPLSGEPRIDQEFVETDVREALLMLAVDGNVDLVVDDKVRGVVNTSIEDMEFEAALEKVLMPLGLVFAKRGSQYLVTTSDPESALFPHVAEQVEYHPQHLAAQDLVTALPRHLERYARVIEKANVVAVDAPRQHAEVILERFRRLDQPIPQVVLEVIVCVVSPDCGFRFGLDWGHVVDKDGTRAFQLGVSGLALSGGVSPAGASAILDDFAVTSAFLKLLAENGYLTIRAAPRVMAKDGEEANISIGSETFFSVQQVPTSTDGDNAAFFFHQEIQKVDSGIVLQLTPHICGDIITVDIEKAEVSEDIRTANPELALNPYPVINRRSVSTTVDVKDGKTIVIGGLVQRQTVDRVSRVAGFCRLPIVGPLFKTVHRREQDAEVAIFISPRIVTPTVAADELRMCATPTNVNR